jgi:hypothetical protein
MLEHEHPKSFTCWQFRHHLLDTLVIQANRMGGGGQGFFNRVGSKLFSLDSLYTEEFAITRPNSTVSA